MKIVYICDRKACGENHECRECRHTSNIKHAANFKRMKDDYYIEKEIQIKTVNELREEQGLPRIIGGDVVVIKDGIVQQ